jgi:phosphoribosylanthranilate isomerase
MPEQRDSSSPAARPPRPGSRPEQAGAERVRVKICGITTAADAALAVELGADYLGLNFWPGSPRAIDVARGREIAAAAGGRAPLVGVFVDSPPAEVERIAREVGLDLVQFSGGEPAALVAPFAPRAIKAFRTGGDPGRAALAGFEQVWGWLFDAAHPTLRGGTGEAWDYARLPGPASNATSAPDAAPTPDPASAPGAVPAPAPRSAGPRVFLAGGLGPHNVRRALAACRPFALDVCSRVESAPGIKDPGLLRRFFEEVRDGEAPRARA